MCGVSGWQAPSPQYRTAPCPPVTGPRTYSAGSRGHLHSSSPSLDTETTTAEIDITVGLHTAEIDITAGLHYLSQHVTMFAAT